MQTTTWYNPRIPVLLLLIGLALLGAISPLLTFTALFQQKEWRLDRLREHMRTEGRFTQLFGKLRPALVLFYWVTLYGPIDDVRILVLSWLSIFALLSLAQIILHRQRMPRRTGKAVAVTGFAFVLTAIVASVTPRLFLPFLILLQPLFVLCAWLLLKPLDLFLKRRIMRKAAELRHSMKNVTVIGIAGSVGKTTVKELIKHLLQDLHPLATPAHVNTEMGVAAWLTNELRAMSHEPEAKNSEPKAQSPKLLIVEMGAYRKGEIALLCDIAQPTIGVMTALGGDHIGLFGSEEAIIEANAELLDALPKEGHAFLLDERLKNRPHCPVTVIGTDLHAENMTEAAEGLRFDLLTKNQQSTTKNLSVPLHGTHNVDNILLAVAVAEHLQISSDRIAALLKTFRPLAHTFNVRTEGGVTLVDDTYNASRLSFLAGLDWAAKRSERPRTLLTSGLMELGNEEDRIMEEMGRKAADSVERVIFTANRGKKAFERGYGKTVEVLDPQTPTIMKSSVLIAIGRMPLSSIQKLLP